MLMFVAVVNYDDVRKATDLQSTEAAASIKGVIAKLQKAQHAAELTMDESSIKH